MKEKHYESMVYSIGIAKERIVHAIKEYVKAAGEDFNEYHRDNFGIDEEDGIEVLKVFSIYDNGGCYFPWTYRCQVDEDSEWYSCAFHCLYVVKEDGVERLKYYLLENCGKEYDSNVSEPDHDYADELPLQILDKLISFIELYDYATE